MSMTERDLQIATVSHWRSSLLVACPNYTPRNWWECDVWGVTLRGYWVEWECKVTLADLKADAEKSQSIWKINEGWTAGNRRKHDAITNAEGPSRFWYVAPKDSGICGTHIPGWAGFATVQRHGARWYHVNIVRNAPLLGRNKCGAREVRLARGRMWHRYWECLRAMNEARIADPKCDDAFAVAVHPNGTNPP